MRKITSFLFSVLMLLGMTAKAETILFQTDFGSEDWVGHETICEGSTAEETINGIYFRCNNSGKQYSIDNGVLTFCDNNSGNNYFMAIPVQNVNGKVIVKLGTAVSSQRVNYLFRETNEISPTGVSMKSTAASDNTDALITIEYEMTGGGTDALVMLGRQGSGQKSVIKTITILTPGEDDYANDATIKSISAGEWEVEAVSGQEYTHFVELPFGTTSISGYELNIVPNSDGAVVSAVSYPESLPGIATFSITSPNGEVVANYSVYIGVEAASADNNLLKAVFSNGFDAFIVAGETNTVKAYYMAGEEAPTLVESSLEHNGESIEIIDNIIAVKATNGSVREYFVSVEAVEPFTDAFRYFDGTETFLKTGGKFDDDADRAAAGTLRGWCINKSQEESENRRVSEGRNRIYFYVGDAAKATFEIGTVNRKIKAFDNNVSVFEGTTTGGEGGQLVLELDAAAANHVIEIRSDNTNGDFGLRSIELLKVSGSSDATLADLKVAGVTIEGFSADVLEYEYPQLPLGTETYPEVTAVKNDEKAADPVITYPASFPGTVTIKVVAENGTSREYKIKFTVEKEPVAPDVLNTITETTLFNFSDLTDGDIVEDTYFSAEQTLLLKAGAKADNKHFTLEANSKTIDGITFTKRLKTNGSSAEDARLIKFQVAGKAKITVYAISSSSSETRNAHLLADGVDVTTWAVGGTAAAYTYAKTDEAEVQYAISVENGINFYGVKVLIGEDPADQVISKSSFFSFSDLPDGTIEEVVYVNEVALVGSSSKKWTVEPNEKYLNSDVKFTKRIKSGGASSEAGRYIRFNVAGPCKIELFAMSGSNGSPRDIKVATEKYDGDVATLTVLGNADLETLTYEYTGEGQARFFINPQASINFYGLAVIFNGEQPYPASIEQAQAEGIRYIGGVVYNDNNQRMQIISAAGQIVADTYNNFDMNHLQSGVYVVRFNNRALKLVK
ncbi:MAG: hypothetical protein IJU35_07200 [Paludibacteraceae bacterium]|nr:hypothetical protein [Paludibacteraceae bacterium]